MKLTKTIALVLALVLCIGLFSGCAASGYTAKNTEYVIGLSGPLTGAAAVYGVAVKNSAQMAVDEINAAGGLNGVKFKLVVMDDMHDAGKIATNYASLVESGMQLSLGTVTTGPGQEFKNLAKDDNVFFLTPSASADDIPEFDNGYQMCFADGVDAAKVTVEVPPTVTSVTPHGAVVKVVKDGHDITSLLDIPTSGGTRFVASATVKAEIVKEPLDPSKGAEIVLVPSAPSITTAPTRPGLTYTFSEGTTLDGMTQKAQKPGDGSPWTPPVTVKGGASGFYSIGVGK